MAKVSSTHLTSPRVGLDASSAHVPSKSSTFKGGFTRNAVALCIIPDVDEHSKLQQRVKGHTVGHPGRGAGISLYLLKPTAEAFRWGAPGWVFRCI
jgi:hypothetical protein